MPKSIDIDIETGGSVAGAGAAGQSSGLGGPKSDFWVQNYRCEKEIKNKLVSCSLRPKMHDIE